jgi:hypothetical protein
MSLDYDNAAVLAHRDMVCKAVDPDKLDTVELFAQFYEEQIGKPLDDIQLSLVKATVTTIESDRSLASERKGGRR